MVAIDIQFEGLPNARRIFSAKASFVARVMPRAGREMFRAVKADIRDEVSGQHYLAGGRKSWPRTKQFGRLAAGRPALRSYAAKWSRAPVTTSANAAEIRVTIPGGGAHVGGGGLERNETVTSIKPRGPAGAMQTAIFRKTGAFVSRRTLLGPGLQLPSRPHANPDNPVTARKVEVIMARRFEGA